MEYNKATMLNMAKEMTRAEFINETKHGKLNNDCPSDYELCEINCICDEEVCINCWAEAVKGIKFKDDTKQKDKESIDNVSLNKPKETEDFDITKCDYITKQQLEKRGFKTGDIVFLDYAHKGIVYDKCISYITKIGWDRIEDIKNKIIEFIPVELIEECAEYTTAFNISNLINKNEINETLHSFIIPIQEEPKIKTICKVSFVVGADNPKEFILENEQVKVGEIVEVCTGSTW